MLPFIKQIKEITSAFINNETAIYPYQNWQKEVHGMVEIGHSCSSSHGIIDSQSSGCDQDSQEIMSLD
jgi:hypothetical protein